MSIDQLLIKGKMSDNRDIVSQCCVCQDFVSKDGNYITLQEQEVLQVYNDYVVSHGYCASCVKEVMKNEKVQEK